MSRGRKRKKPAQAGRRGRPKRQETPRQPRANPGFDPTVYLDEQPPASEAELQRTLDRRLFTMPFYGTTIDGEDFDRLDASDPDQRSLLIKGEHPELHEALADLHFDAEAAGFNPRLHLTMHEVIANQLWDDDPPEVWQAAQRLRDEGMERHDILHALAEVMLTHLHPTLVDQTPFDTEAYRRDLDDLGRDADG